MSDKNHPLDEYFNTDSGVDEFEDDDFKIEIPENPTLSDIARLALEAYRDQMGDSLHIEPKYRARNLEVSEKYLNLAKEAIHKKEELKLKQEKQDGTDKDKDKPAEGMSRADVLKLVNTKK